MPITPKQTRAVREDSTIERPARKISMVDGYAEENAAAEEAPVPPVEAPASAEEAPVSEEKTEE